MFFIILITIASNILVQAYSETEENNYEDIAEICDTLACSKAFPTEFGYDDEHLMKMSDIMALSMMLDDDKAAEYVSKNLDCIYAWPNAYYLEITLGEHIQYHNTYYDNYTDSLQRNYIVEYGTELTIKIYLYY